MSARSCQLQNDIFVDYSGPGECENQPCGDYPCRPLGADYLCICPPDREGKHCQSKMHLTDVTSPQT